MVSTRRCINQAGPLSRIRLPVVPQLETELELDSAAVTAVGCWFGRVGEIFTVIDSEQNEYRARIVAVTKESVRVLPFAQIPNTESLLRIELFQALPEKERFELVLQKATELGAVRIVPYVSAKSSTLGERDAGQKKSHRWPDVLLRAARQCRRAEIPELSPVLEWDEALVQCGEAELSLLCSEKAGGWPLAEAIDKFRGQRVALMVGPEGGFSAEEIEQARQRGILPVSLGPRILRTETAAIAGLTAIQFAAGDFGR